MSIRRSRLATLFAAVLALTVVATPAFAGRTPAGSTVTWTGNGIASDGNGGYVLNSSQCDANETPYALFILASTRSVASPTIRFGADTPIAMTQSNSGRKGTSSWRYTYLPGAAIDLAALLALPVTASWTGTASPTLTLSHGCIGTGTGGGL